MASKNEMLILSGGLIVGALIAATVLDSEDPYSREGGNKKTLTPEQEKYLSWQEKELKSRGYSQKTIQVKIALIRRKLEDPMAEFSEAELEQTFSEEFVDSIEDIFGPDGVADEIFAGFGRGVDEIFTGFNRGFEEVFGYKEKNDGDKAA